MKILRALQIESVNLCVPSQKATGDSRRKSNALSPAREQGIVARIIDEAAIELAFNGRSGL